MYDLSFIRIIIGFRRSRRIQIFSNYNQLFECLLSSTSLKNIHFFKSARLNICVKFLGIKFYKLKLAKEHMNYKN